MIERLMNMERPHEEAEQRKLSEKIVGLKQQLCGQLSPQGKERLEQLADAYLEQGAALQERSFMDGFCAAVDLALEYLEYTTTNQQRPPKP